MDTARYVVAVLTVTFLPPALLWWFLVHPFVGFWRGFGPRVTLIVMGILGVAGVVGLLTVRDVLVGNDLGTQPALLVVAALLLTVSVTIAVLRKRYLTTRILAGVPELSGDGERGELLSDGIYARMRHPRYVEVAVGTLAYAAFANYTGAYVMAFLTLPALHAIVLLEERELIDRFGEAYETYAARVPRYLPKRGA